MAIEVTICTGPVCGRCSSAELVHLVHKLGRQHAGCLELTTQHCFARCQVDDGRLCPSVRIDGDWMHEVTVPKLKSKLTRLIKQLEHDVDDDPDDPFAKLLRTL